MGKPGHIGGRARISVHGCQQAASRFAHPVVLRTSFARETARLELLALRRRSRPLARALADRRRVRARSITTSVFGSSPPSRSTSRVAPYRTSATCVAMRSSTRFARQPSSSHATTTSESSTSASNARTCICSWRHAAAAHSPTACAASRSRRSSHQSRRSRRRLPRLRALSRAVAAHAARGPQLPGVRPKQLAASRRTSPHGLARRQLLERDRVRRGHGKLFTTPPDYSPLVVWPPRTWLVTTAGSATGSSACTNFLATRSSSTPMSS